MCSVFFVSIAYGLFIVMKIAWDNKVREKEEDVDKLRLMDCKVKKLTYLVTCAPCYLHGLILFSCSCICKVY